METDSRGEESKSIGESQQSAESAERALNEAAYRRLREHIRANYPHGRFVGIAGGKIVADAGSFRDLHEMLNGMGFTSSNNFIVEAGVDYPEMMIILNLDPYGVHALGACTGAGGPASIMAYGS